MARKKNHDTEQWIVGGKYPQTQDPIQVLHRETRETPPDAIVS